MTDNPRLEDLRRRVQSDPASIAFAALAEEYRRAGRYDEAIATCTGGLTRHPSYLSAHVTLGRALTETGRFEDARDTLELVLRAAPENLAAIQALADLRSRQDGSGPSSAEPASPPIPPALSLVPDLRSQAELRALGSFLTAVRSVRQAR